MKRTKTKEKSNAFDGGIIAALGVLHQHDIPTIYDEIVATTDEKSLIAFARRNGDLEWSGLADYIKRKRND